MLISRAENIWAISDRHSVVIPPRTISVFLVLGLLALGQLSPDTGEDAELADTTPDCMTESECWETQTGHAGGVLFWAKDMPGQIQFLEAMPLECRIGRSNLPTEAFDYRDPNMVTIGELLRNVVRFGPKRTEVLRERFPEAMAFTKVTCNGHSDWYLPSGFELWQMIRQPEDWNSPFKKDALEPRGHYSVGPYLTTEFGKNWTGPETCLLMTSATITSLRYDTCWDTETSRPFYGGTSILIRHFTVPKE